MSAGARLTFIVAAIAAAAMVAAFILGIWLADSRWTGTGFILLVVAVISVVVGAALAGANDGNP